MPLRPPFVPREPRSLRGAVPREPLTVDAPQPPIGPLRERDDEPTVRVEHPEHAGVVPAAPGTLLKKPPVRSADFLAFVRAMTCCVCSAPAPSDPHHYGRWGMGQKTDDLRSVPLCRRCHDYFHDHRCFSVLGLDTTATAHVWLVERQVAILVAWVEELNVLAQRASKRLR